MRAIVPLFVILAVLVSGCISDVPASYHKNERVADFSQTDLDGNVASDIYAVTFEKTQTGDGATWFQRSFFASAESELDDFKPKPMNVTTANEVRRLIMEFENRRRTDDASCLQKLGLTNVLCVDRETCMKLCSSASQACKAAADGSPELLGDSVLKYSRDENNLLSNLQLINSQANQLETLDETGMGSLASNMIAVMNSIRKMDTNPVMQQSAFGLCRQSDFGATKLRAALDMIGTYEEKTARYDYLTVIEVGSAHMDGMLMEVSVSDRPPNIISSDMEMTSPFAVTFDRTAVPPKVRFPAFNIYEKDERRLFSYSFYSTSTPELTVNKWTTPDVAIKRYDISAAQVALVPAGAVQQAVGNRYGALGFGIGVALAILFFMYFLLGTAYGWFLLRKPDEPAAAGLKKVYGQVNDKWLKSIIVGVVMLGVGFYLARTINATDVAEAADFGAMLQNIVSDIPSFAVFALFLLGVLYVYFGIINLVKSFVIKRFYGEKIKKDVEEADRLYESMRKLYRETEETIDELSQNGIDLKEEKAELYAVGIERLGSLVDKPGKQTMDKLTAAKGRVRAIADGLEERKENAEKNWRAWEAEIREKTSKEGRVVFPTQLVGVPVYVRDWAIKRYLKAHPEEGLMYDGEKIIQTKMAFQQERSEEKGVPIVKEETPEKAAIPAERQYFNLVAFKDEKMETADIREGNRTVITALVHKLRMNLDTMGVKLAGGAGATHVMGIGSRNVFVGLRGDGREGYFFVRKERFNDALRQWKEGG